MVSCNEDIDNSYSRNQSVIELQPSGEFVKLDENNPDATALTLDWTTAHNYGDDYMVPKNNGSSHDYPFYKEQMLGLKEVMEQEFNQKISDELMEQLIDMKVKSALQ